MLNLFQKVPKFFVGVQKNTFMVTDNNRFPFSMLCSIHKHKQAWFLHKKGVQVSREDFNRIQKTTQSFPKKTLLCFFMQHVQIFCQYCSLIQLFFSKLLLRNNLSQKIFYNPPWPWVRKTFGHIFKYGKEQELDQKLKKIYKEHVALCFTAG